MDKSAHDSKVLLFSIKISCMVFLFLVIIVVGSLPIRLAAFQTNKVITIDHKLKVLLACTAAFSGGLFFSVGLLHLLSESSANFEEYFATNGSDPGEEHFPYAFLTATLSFTFVLWIEKIAVSHQHDNHHHEPSHEVSELSKVRDSHENNDALIDRHQSAPVLIERNNSAPIGYQENCTQDEEQNFRNQVSVKINIAKKITHARKQNEVLKRSSVVQKGKNSLTPYILQIAIGMHAVFEGLSIGIESRAGACLGLALAVSCHKWAEGLTLGLAFRQAGVPKGQATLMIFIQAIMNPIGIGVGWALSSSGPLIVGIFYAISSGTFIYISTVEVIVEEFSISRYKWIKFLLFLVAIALVSSLWFIEQASK